MRIGVMVIKIIVHCFHHRPWHLGSAGSIEIGYRMTEMSARKRRETSPRRISSIDIIAASEDFAVSFGATDIEVR